MVDMHLAIEVAADLAKIGKNLESLLATADKILSSSVQKDTESLKHLLSSRERMQAGLEALRKHA